MFFFLNSYRNHWIFLPKFHTVILKEHLTSATPRKLKIRFFNPFHVRLKHDLSTSASPQLFLLKTAAVLAAVFLLMQEETQTFC